MGTDSGIPDASEGRRLAQDQHNQFLERLHQLKLEGAKGLVTLNGGAAVAMLAFVQALVGRLPLSVFKPYAVYALSLFLVGAFLAGVTFFFQYSYILHAYYRTKRFQAWRHISWGLLVAAAIAAFAGGAVVVTGVRCAL